ncbi:selenocysteine-specific translation elongation factor [Rubritalea marina]|uniref:selenocysteine-specific translation elongation factor n=1 Tax=Rubritalea marina TaxID=361055 RepID=UPI000382350E|nr:selenocysteine-specific translation elongation factor [Rubritalea marina]
MHIILGTAGHIDHGKSSLTQALTGIDPDRLPEEKQRGVTIELGFAHLTLEEFEIGLIDVPGHADFINNMVSGVGALDIALFIVAADDGWMPQSEEHLQILNYLGIDNVIVVLTKSDLAEDLEFTTELVKEELIGTSLEHASIFPVSSHTGDGLDALKAEIVKRARDLATSPKHHIPRLHVDRAFSPKGAGTVVTGTLTGQPLSAGEELISLPEALSATIRKVQNHQQSIDSSVSGMRTALNLPDLPLKQRGKPGVGRGSLLTLPGHLEPVSTIDVTLTRAKREVSGQSATSRAIKNTETVVLHHGTSRIKARVILNDRSKLELGDSCFAQLRLESPIPACIGDRFVLRDGGQQGTLAGGAVLDPSAQARGFRTPERKAFLELRQEHPEQLRHIILSELSKSPASSQPGKVGGWVSSCCPVANTPFTREHQQKTCEKLAKEKKLISRGEFLIAPKWWKESVGEAAQLIDQWHRSHPDAPSLPLNQWRSELSSHSIPSQLHDIIEDHLLKSGYIKQQDGLAHENHSLELPDRLVSIGNSLLKKYQDAGLEPAPRIDMAPDESAKQALQFLIRSGQITELDPKALLAADHYQSLRHKVIDFIQGQGQATAGEIREASGASRKYIMPLLESLDAEGITRRDGDYRSLAHTSQRG